MVGDKGIALLRLKGQGGKSEKGEQKNIANNFSALYEVFP